jgi:hypothetical protein
MLSFRDFLDYADRLCRQAHGTDHRGCPNAYVIGSILSSWMSIESFINNMMGDFAKLPPDMFSVHERGFLQEKQVLFETAGDDAGTFRLDRKPDFRHLEDKILFLIAKFGGQPRDKGKKHVRQTDLWRRFQEIKKKRNALSHPRRAEPLELSPDDARDAIQVARGIIEFVSQAVWKKPVKW